MKNKQKIKQSLSLMERMNKHLTLTEAQNYQLNCPDELMEYMWLKPNITGLNVDIFVDDGESYIRNNHTLLLFARNGYGTSSNEFIPFSICEHPNVLDENMNFNISYDEIFTIQDFIVYNLNDLILLSNKQITQEKFVQNIKTVKRLVVEHTLNEMATLRSNESKLPLDIWLDEGGTYQGHAPRIKFKASNEQKTTHEFSSMLLTNPQTIENLPQNCPIRKKDIDKIKQFVINNLNALLLLSDGKIDYLTEFKPNMII